MSNISRRECLSALAGLAAATTWMSRAAGKAKWRPIELGIATALDIAAGLRAGEWTARDVIEWHIERVESTNGPFESYESNGALNAFMRITPDLARETYRQARRARNGGAWVGIPVALKDIIDVAGLPATGGTPAHRSYRADRDSAVWRKWCRSGAVLIGQTQCQRFVTGLTTPQTANPWNQSLIAGGSSGGSAAAVAAGLVPIALGTETDGSLIYPAACCGVTTLKPSHGLLSLDGVYPGLPSFDVVGPIARTAADCAWAMATLARVDAEDRPPVSHAPPAIEWPHPATASTSGDRPFEGLSFLVSTNERYRNLRTRQAGAIDPRIGRAFEGFLKSLEELGARIVLASVSHDLGRYGVFRTEKNASTGNMSAYDLIVTSDELTGHFPGLYRRLARASDAEREIAVRFYNGSGPRLESESTLEHSKRVTQETLSVANVKREEFRTQWENLLAHHGCDAHIYLEIGSALPARKGLEDTPVPDASREGVVPCDLGWPVLSLPVSRVDGLDAPVSAQIMARRWQDHLLLAWGIEWQRRHPDRVYRAPESAPLTRVESLRKDSGRSGPRARQC